MTSAFKTGRAVTVILLTGVLSALMGCSESEVQAVEGSAKAAKLTQCVRPTEFMRRNHMELIKHQRDVTVHQGVRATPYSLASCIACHVQYDAQGQAVPVNAEGQFCDRCHDRLAVHLDCFQCHSPIPQGPQITDLAQIWSHGAGPAMGGGIKLAGQEKGN